MNVNLKEKKIKKQKKINLRKNSYIKNKYMSFLYGVNIQLHFLFLLLD